MCCYDETDEQKLAVYKGGQKVWKNSLIKISQECILDHIIYGNIFKCSEVIRKLVSLFLFLFFFNLSFQPLDKSLKC